MAEVPMLMLLIVMRKAEKQYPQLVFICFKQKVNRLTRCIQKYIFSKLWKNTAVAA